MEWTPCWCCGADYDRGTTCCSEWDVCAHCGRCSQHCEPELSLERFGCAVTIAALCGLVVRLDDGEDGDLFAMELPDPHAPPPPHTGGPLTDLLAQLGDSTEPVEFRWWEEPSEPFDGRMTTIFPPIKKGDA